MKMLVLACLGATAAAIPFQQSSSTEVQALRELDALILQQAASEALLQAYATAQVDLRTASEALNLGEYTPAHSAYQRLAVQAQRDEDLRATQRDIEQQIEVLRLEWRKLERSRELMETRAELETLEARQQLRHDQRERVRALEMASRDLEVEAVAVDQHADEISADLERHFVEELARAEAANAQALAARRSEMQDQLTAERAAADVEIRTLHEQLEQATAAEQSEDARILLRALDALTAKVEAKRESGEYGAEAELDAIRTKFEAECRSQQKGIEAEIQNQRMKSRKHMLEIEMQRRDIESRRDELDEQNDFAEERLVLERQLVQRERELAMEAEMEQMEMLVDRLERELERAADRDDDDDECDEDDDEDECDEDEGAEDAYHLARALHAEAADQAAAQAHGNSATDERFEAVFEAIDGLRSDVNALRRDVDKLMKRAESVR